MDGSWLFATLVVFTWVGWCRSDPEAPFPTCSQVPAAAWWKPLIVNGLDPCQLQRKLADAGINTACCFPNLPLLLTACGPCNQETFNIAMACLLCNGPTASSPTPPDVSKTWAHLLKFSEFKNVTTINPPFPFLVVSWMNTPPQKDLFDARGAVKAADQSQSTPSPSVLPTNPIGTNSTPPDGGSPLTPISPVPTTSSSARKPIPPESFGGTTPRTHMTPKVVMSSSTSAATASNVVNPTSPASQASPKSNTGAIAGGVIGGLVALGLIIFGVFYVRRHQKNARIPASARFMTVPEGNLQDDSPPPFTQGGWNSPLAEKVVTTAELQSQYNQQRSKIY